eukprot:2268929-Amphidinium_carterae.1
MEGFTSPQKSADPPERFTSWVSAFKREPSWVSAFCFQATEVQEGCPNRFSRSQFVKVPKTEMKLVYISVGYAALVQALKSGRFGFRQGDKPAIVSVSVEQTDMLEHVRTAVKGQLATDDVQIDLADARGMRIQSN